MRGKILKRTISLFLAFILVVCMFSSALAAESAEVPDLPWGFEEWPDDMYGLVACNDRGGTADIALSSGVARTGENSVFASNRTTLAAGPQFNLTPYIEIGPKYKASVWVYSMAAGNTTFAIRVVSGARSDNYPGVSAEKYLSYVTKSVPPQTWTELTFEFRFGSNQLNGFYIETTNGTAGSQNFYVDDLSFELIPGDQGYQYDDTLPPLKDAYSSYFHLGNIITPTEVSGIRNDLLRNHFSIVSCENLMKPSYMSSGPHIYTPERGDIMLETAEEAGLLMHGHTLVWHSQSAPWLNPAGTTREEAKANLEEYIKNIAGHYSGRIVSWDVVNEIMGTGSNANWKLNTTNTPWKTAYGNGMAAGEENTDFIYDAFVFARKYDPFSKLYYNDFSMNNQNKATSVAAMVKEFNERYAEEYPEDSRKLIEGVGMQGHYSVTTNLTDVENSIRKFIEAGVDVSFTELDITIRGTNPTEAAFTEQADVYARIFYLFKKYSHYIDRITLWGMDDANNWKPTGYAYLFNEDLSAKPAFWATLDPEGYLEVDPIPGLTATAAASVNKLEDQNELTITVTEDYFDGMTGQMAADTIIETFSIANNASGIYRVGSYNVYVKTSGTQVLSCYIVGDDDPTDGIARVSFAGNSAITVKDDAEYVVSVKNVDKLATVTAWFDVDGDYFSGKDITGLNGFEALGDIVWEAKGGSRWSGRVTLAILNSSLTSDTYQDILKLTLAAKGEEGVTDVKLTRVDLSGYDGESGAVFFDSAIVNGTVSTSIGKFFSVYDVNRDGVVSQLDLTFAQLYYKAESGDDNWEAAKIADINGDNIVDIADLILILNNITW